MLQTAITALYQKIIQFVQDIFDMIFQGWNYGVLFNWLPQDIQAAASFLILFLFALALIHLIRDMLPF